MVNLAEAGHPDATDLTRDFSPGNSDAMDILTLGLELGLGLGRVLRLIHTGVVIASYDVFVQRGRF